MDKVSAKHVYEIDELSNVVINFGNDITIDGVPIDEYVKEKGQKNESTGRTTISL